MTCIYPFMGYLTDKVGYRHRALQVPPPASGVFINNRQ